MKKKWFSIPLILAMVVALCACGPVELSNTIDATDGSVSIDTPDNWSYDSEDPDNYIMLAITDNDGAFAYIYYYPSAEGYTMDEIQDYKEGYYEGNIIGNVEDTEIDDHDAVYFEYSMVDMGEDYNEYNYHGYEYVIAFDNGIVEVDIFYSQGKLEGKIFNPSAGELELLRRIAESVKANI